MYVRYFNPDESFRPRAFLGASDLDRKIKIKLAEEQINRLDELEDQLDIYVPEDNVFHSFFNRILGKRHNKQAEELRETIGGMKLLLGEIMRRK
jgi:truncated hemoglobin YjbI